MAKNKSNNRQYVKTDIDYDKLAEAIIKAHQKIKDIETKELEKQSKDERNEWCKIIGYVEYPENEKWLLKKWHSVKNDVTILKSIITFKAKDAKTPRLSFELIRLGTSLIYGLCELLLYIIALFWVCGLFFYTGFDKIYSLLLFPTFLFARIFRIAELEVENLKDRELLNTIFTANMSFIGVVLAVLAIIIEVWGR